MSADKKKKLNAEEVSRRSGLKLYNDYDDPWTQTKGRTYYYSPKTMRGFGGRVLATQALRGGLLLACVVSDSHPTDGRIYRAVVHDLDGDCVYRSLDGDKERRGFSKAKHAEDDLVRWERECHSELKEAKRILDRLKHKHRRALVRLNGKD